MTETSVGIVVVDYERAFLGPAPPANSQGRQAVQLNPWIWTMTTQEVAP